MTQADNTDYVPLGNEPPSAAAEISRREIEARAALAADESTLGEVYRLIVDGLSPAEIQERQGVATIGYVYAYQRSIRAMIGDPDRFPDKPSVARGVAQAFRRVLKRAQFSDVVRQELEHDLTRLDRVVADEAAATVETEAAIDATKQVEAEIEEATVPNSAPNAGGVIYVYSLPHYLRHRIHDETGRTYLKVGKTIREPDRRINEQARQTGLPEDPVLLRYYRDDHRSTPVGELERTFHTLIEAADHDRSRARSAGTEWFTTSVKFTDAVARALGLTIVEVSDLGN